MGSYNNKKMQGKAISTNMNEWGLLLKSLKFIQPNNSVRGAEYSGYFMKVSQSEIWLFCSSVAKRRVSHLLECIENKSQLWEAVQDKDSPWLKKFSSKNVSFKKRFSPSTYCRYFCFQYLLVIIQMLRGWKSLSPSSSLSGCARSVFESGKIVLLQIKLICQT